MAAPGLAHKSVGAPTATAYVKLWLNMSKQKPVLGACNPVLSGETKIYLSSPSSMSMSKTRAR